MSIVRPYGTMSIQRFYAEAQAPVDENAVATDGVEMNNLPQSSFESPVKVESMKRKWVPGSTNAPIRAKKIARLFEF
jgi:hypothetical protein